MSWAETISLVVVLTAAFVGLAAAMFLVGQRPAFWVGAIVEIARRAWPSIREYLLRRNTPEIEAKMAECIRRGGEWDNFNKRCRDK